MSLNSTMSIAARSLEVFQTGIEVAGQNIANANTPGYVREEMRIQTAPTYQRGREIHGMGSLVTGIRLAIQTQLETRIHSANSDLAGAQIRQEAYHGLEAALAELGTGDLSTKTNEMLAALNEFVNEPTLPGLREFVISEGAALADAITYTRSQVDGLRGTINTQIEATIEEANELVRRVEDLNKQIIRLEGAGTIKSDATGLRSDRLAALDRLSEIVPIEVRELPTGFVEIRFGGEYLLIEGSTQGFDTYVPDENEGSVYGIGVQFSRSEYRQVGPGGELNGLLTARDEIIGGFADELDDYASAFLFEFNKIHAQGRERPVSLPSCQILVSRIRPSR